MTRTAIAAQIADLAGQPDVHRAVRAAEEACAQLRWHPALRKQADQAAAESRVRGAAASALLEGAEVAGSVDSLQLVRDVMRGALDLPADPDPVWRATTAAIQVTAATETISGGALAAPAQVLARLHSAAAIPLMSSTYAGRPRQAGQDCAEWTELGPACPAEQLPARLAGIGELISAGRAGVGPAIVVTSLVHAEVIAARPFVAGNALVARALERLMLHRAGVDPLGVAVVEAGHAVGGGGDYRGAMTAYVEGGSLGVALWLVHCAEAVTEGAARGRAVADAVFNGTLTNEQITTKGARGTEYMTDDDPRGVVL
ncbi:MAG: hypothetical protein WBG57_08210 [Ornithinimicrobium sp.]